MNIVLVDHSLKTKKDIQKFKEKGYSRYIYQKELDEACFQHDITYGDFKTLTRTTSFDKNWVIQST